jgi:hypothetical protein
VKIERCTISCTSRNLFLVADTGEISFTDVEPEKKIGVIFEHLNRLLGIVHFSQLTWLEWRQLASADRLLSRCEQCFPLGARLNTLLDGHSYAMWAAEAGLPISRFHRLRQ